jgi:hypothetical protein
LILATILLVRPNRPTCNHLLHNETLRIEAATMPALSFVTDDQIAACERCERRIESLSLQCVRAHMDGTEGREIVAANGMRMPCRGPVLPAASTFVTTRSIRRRAWVFVYRCPICRPELVLDANSNKLTVAPLKNEE